MARPEQRPLVVGIAGGTASGKSTVADALSETLGDDALLLAQDRYYHSVSPDSPDLYAHNFDHPSAVDLDQLARDLAAFRTGAAIRVPDYVFATHQRTPEDTWEWLQPHPVLVLEGLFVLGHEAVRAQLDHAIYVHAPDDLRLLRRIRRDLDERGRHLDEVLEQWERTVSPSHHLHIAPSRVRADLVLDGTAPLPSLVASVMRLIAR